jgi:hypothetical protein
VPLFTPSKFIVAWLRPVRPAPAGGVIKQNIE